MKLYKPGDPVYKRLKPDPDLEAKNEEEKQKKIKYPVVSISGVGA